MSKPVILPAKLARDERGIALVEFAFVLPFLVLLFIGGYQLMDGISAYRKVGATVRTLADLTTQNTTINDTGADEILNAARQVMTPYSTETAELRISQIQVKASGQAIVNWSRVINGSPYVAGSAITIPPRLAQTPDTYYIFSEINYKYVPTMGAVFIGTVPLRQTIYMSPRNSQFVAYN